MTSDEFQFLMDAAWHFCWYGFSLYHLFLILIRTDEETSKKRPVKVFTQEEIETMCNERASKYTKLLQMGGNWFRRGRKYHKRPSER